MNKEKEILEKLKLCYDENELNKNIVLTLTNDELQFIIRKLGSEDVLYNLKANGQPMKIKFIQDMFTSPLECVEKDAILILIEKYDCFEIYSDNMVVGRWDYESKEDIYKNFIILNENTNE